MALLGSLVLSMSARTTELERGLSRARREVSITAKAVQQSAAQVRNALLGAFSVGGAIAGLTGATRLIAGFQEQMAAVRSVTQATDAQLATLTATARELGGATQFSAREAAEGMQALGQAGFTTNQILAAIPATLDLAAAGGLELGRAADIASNTLSAFNLAASETVRVADVLAATAAKSNTNVEQLGQAMKFAAPTAAGLGISIEETAAAIGVLSNRGLQATQAGEGLRRVLSLLVNPTKENRKLFAELDKIYTDVDLSLSRGLNPAVNTLSDILKRLQPVLTDQQLAFRLFGTEGANIAAILSQNTTEFDGLREAVRSSGQAAEQARIRNDSLAGAMKALNSAVEELILNMGSSGLAAALRDMATLMTELARSSDSLSAGLGGGLGAVIRGLGLVVTVAIGSLELMGKIIAGVTAVLVDFETRGLRGAFTTARVVFADLDRTILQFGDNIRRVLGQMDELDDRTRRFNRAIAEGRALAAQDPFVLQAGLADGSTRPRPVANPRVTALLAEGQEKAARATRTRVDAGKRLVEQLEAELFALRNSEEAVRRHTIETTISNTALRQRALALADLIAAQTKANKALEDFIADEKLLREETAAAEAALFEGLGEAMRDSLVASADEAGAAVDRLRVRFRQGLPEVTATGSRAFDSLADAAESMAERIGDSFLVLSQQGSRNFSDLIDSILFDLQRLAIQQAIVKPIGDALGQAFRVAGATSNSGGGFLQTLGSFGGTFASALFGLGGGASGPGNSGTLGSVTDIGAGGGTLDFARGGIMTGRGRARLSRFQGGGIARNPQLAVFGEGSTPEAFVPLPDGRRIPVAIEGGGGQAQTVNFIFPGGDAESFRRSEAQVRARLLSLSQLASQHQRIRN